MKGLKIIYLVLLALLFVQGFKALETEKKAKKKGFPKLPKAPKMRNPITAIKSKISEHKKGKAKKIEEKINQLKIERLPIFEKNEETLKFEIPEIRIIKEIKKELNGIEIRGIKTRKIFHLFSEFFIYHLYIQYPERGTYGQHIIVLDCKRSPKEEKNGLSACKFISTLKIEKIAKSSTLKTEVISSPPIHKDGVTCSSIVLKEPESEEKRLFCVNEKNAESENLVQKINSEMGLYPLLVSEGDFIGTLFTKYSPIEDKGKVYPLYFPLYIKFRFPTISMISKKPDG